MKLFLSTIAAGLVVMLVVEGKSGAGAPGSATGPVAKVLYAPQSEAAREAQPLPVKTLPDYVFKDMNIPGLDLFGAYWRLPGNKVVFSGQCFDQHKRPDYCAVYSSVNATLCTSLGTTRQAAGGIIECELEETEFGCPDESLLPLTAVIGRKGEGIAHRATLQDYRGAASGRPGRYLSMCSIFKVQSSNADLNRQRFLEWLTYHELVGVDHFYLYDHRSDDGQMKALKPLFDYYTERGKLTVRRADMDHMCHYGKTGHESTHEWAYADCSARYGDLDTWIAFPDSDEFLYPGDDYETIPEYLKTLDKRDNVLGVYMPWYLFGTSGHKSRPQGTIIENYVKAEPPRCFTGRSNWYDNFCTGKIMGRADRMGYLTFPHLIDYDNTHGQYGAHTHPDWWSDANMIKKDRDRLLFNRPEPSNRYCDEGKPCMYTPPIKSGLATWHYYTQSEQDWKEKMSRGCVGGCSYTLQKMHEHDRKADQEETRMRDRFAARVKAAMEDVERQLGTQNSS